MTAVRGDDVECEVVNGGLLGERKGINLPGTVVSVPSLTEKDEKDLEFGLKHGVDIVAVSFIRTANDVRLVKRLAAAAQFRCMGDRQAGKASGHRSGEPGRNS